MSRDTHGTHGTHGRTRAHGSHGRTSQPSTQIHATLRHTHANRDVRLNSHKNSRKPGVDRSPVHSTVPVQRHRGEPGRTRDRDTRTSQTNLKTNPTKRLTRAPDHTRTPGAGCPGRKPARVAPHATPHHSPASAVVVTVMATAPGRGSSEGASPTVVLYGCKTTPRQTFSMTVFDSKSQTVIDKNVDDSVSQPPSSTYCVDDRC